MKNRIVIEYLYGDAGNYKIYEEVEIPNPSILSFGEFEIWFRNQLIDELYFIPHDFGLVKPQLPTYNPELAHVWCELIGLKEI